MKEKKQTNMSRGGVLYTRKVKAFTLIELLAVIVILAIIAVIATPIILGVINDSKYKAFKLSLNNIEHAYELYATQNNIEPGTEIDINKLPLDSKNLKGKVFLNSEGKIELKEVTDGTYSAEGTLDDLSMLKGTVEDLLANRLEINVNVITNARSLVVTVETIDGVPTSYSYQILEPEEYKKEINNIKENTYTFDKLKIDTEYKIKVIVKNKVGLTKEITKTVRTEKIDDIKLELNPKDEYIKEGTVTITYPKLDNVTYRYSWDSEEFVEADVSVNENNVTTTIPAKNGTLTAVVADGEEIVLSKPITINNIDTLGPTYTKEINMGNVTIKASDDKSGLHESAYSCDGVYQTSNICKFTAMGNHTINVRDALENVGEEQIVTIVSGVTKESTIPSKQHVGVKAIIYLNPSNLTEKCTSSNINSDTGIKTGCMKWYAYEETSSTYTAILDHNTTDKIVWYSNNNFDDSEIMQQLKKDTSNWDKNLAARLISVDEILNVVDKERTSGFDPKTCGSNTWLVFETHAALQVECVTNENCKYAWLNDRTNINCKSKYGCLNDATGNHTGLGYWTSTTVIDLEKRVWSVDFGGNFQGGKDASYGRGIRPVITIPKSLITN